MSNFQQKITHHSLRRQKKKNTKTESKPDSSITSFLKSENFKYDNGKKKKVSKDE